MCVNAYTTDPVNIKRVLCRACALRVMRVSCMVQVMPNGLLTSPQVAHLLGCSTRTVHRLVTSEELIPAQKLPGPNGAYLFRRSDVEALLAEPSEVAG